MEIKSVVPDRVPGPAKLFLIATALNGIGNGMINVVFQLYLISLGFLSAAIGAMTMMNSLGAVILTIPAGILADRYGKKKVMICGFIMIGFSVWLFLVAKTMEMFIFTFLLIGLSNATFVVLTPLYSSFFDNADMDRAFGLHGFISVITMSAGSVIGFIPPFLVKNYGFSLQSSYWTVIAIAGAVILVQMPFYLMSIREVVNHERRNGFKFTLKSRGVVSKFFLLSLISNIGGNVFFNLFPFYVNRRFGIESDALGTLFFVSNFVSAGANALAPRFSHKLGALKTIAVVMGLATPFYLMIPLAPSFAWLSALYIIRLGFRTIADPLMSSLFMRMLHEDEKSTGNSIRQMAFQSGGVIAPWIGGQLMETSLDLPIFLGTGLYATFVPLSYMLLRDEKEIVVEPAMPS